jgi:DNA-binding response OmpR family regulator
MGYASISAAQGGGGDKEQEPAEHRERPRVLVVDDDEQDRQLYGMMLCYNGFDVVFAGSIRAGRDLARQYAPDLVLLDLGLPDGNGLELCAQLRRSNVVGNLPVIVLSGFRREELGETAMRHGCADYVEKPASPLAVMRRIEELIGKPPLAGDGEPPAVLDRKD